MAGKPPISFKKTKFSPQEIVNQLNQAITDMPSKLPTPPPTPKQQAIYEAAKKAGAARAARMAAQGQSPSSQAAPPANSIPPSAATAAPKTKPATQPNFVQQNWEKAKSTANNYWAGVKTSFSSDVKRQMWKDMPAQMLGYATPQLLAGSVIGGGAMAIGGAMFGPKQTPAQQAVSVQMMGAGVSPANMAMYQPQIMLDSEVAYKEKERLEKQLAIQSFYERQLSQYLAQPGMEPAVPPPPPRRYNDRRRDERQYY